MKVDGFNLLLCQLASLPVSTKETQVKICKKNFDGITVSLLCFALLLKN